MLCGSTSHVQSTDGILLSLDPPSLTLPGLGVSPSIVNDMLAAYMAQGVRPCSVIQLPSTSPQLFSPCELRRARCHARRHGIEGRWGMKAPRRRRDGQGLYSQQKEIAPSPAHRPGVQVFRTSEHVVTRSPAKFHVLQAALVGGPNPQMNFSVYKHAFVYCWGPKTLKIYF